MTQPEIDCLKALLDGRIRQELNKGPQHMMSPEASVRMELNIFALNLVARHQHSFPNDVCRDLKSLAREAKTLAEAIAAVTS